MNEETASMMHGLGGSFAKALATAWCCADPDNRARLEAAFPELIAKYERLVKVAAEGPI